MNTAQRAAFALLALATPMLPAQAQTAARTPSRDVRCLMLSNLFVKAAPAAAGKEAAGQSRLFYLGRVSGKYSQPQLQTAMNAEAKTIDPGKVGGEMNKCLASVQAAAAAVETAGKKAQLTVTGGGTGPTVPAPANPKAPVGR